MGARAFARRLTSLSAESRWMQAYQHGRGPDPSVDESIDVLNGI